MGGRCNQYGESYPMYESTWLLAHVDTMKKKHHLLQGFGCFFTILYNFIGSHLIISSLLVAPRLIIGSVHILGRCGMLRTPCLPCGFGNSFLNLVWNWIFIWGAHFWRKLKSGPWNYFLNHSPGFTIHFGL